MPKTTTHLERLSLKNGKFLLAEVSTPKLREKLRSSAHWKDVGNDTYETADLGSARAFRYCADKKLELIFKKRFQEFYPLTESLALNLRKLDIDEHQYQGILWALTRKRSYLAHAPGAGKTAEAILASHYASGPGQVLFIVPPSLVKNWEREILKFTEWVGVFPTIGIIGRSDKKDSVAWNAEFLICPDSMLTKDWVYERLSKLQKRFLAVDEASRFKDASAERSLGLYGGSLRGSKYSGLIRVCRHVAFLDGSPMPNRPIELWAPTFALDPEAIDCMSYDDFGYRYCGAKPNEFGQWEYLYSSNEEELKTKLQRDFMHVVPEEALTHPERRRSMVVLSEDVRSREHREWERASLKHFGKDWLGGTFETQGDVAHFRKELGIRKVPGIAQYTKEKLEKGESILLFVWHRDVAEKLDLALRGFSKNEEPALIIGGTPEPLREVWFRQFNTGERKLLIMNIAAAGRGLNLQRADRVIFGEFSWTDETNKQAEKRASRKGSTKKFVKCDYLVCPNSMDEIILKSVFSKQRRVKRIIG